MIVIGAKGFAKELLEVCHQLGRTENLVFFDNVNSDLPKNLFGQFPILSSENDVKAYFENTSKDFALGLGNPKLREQMCYLFEDLGGTLKSIISPNAIIPKFGLDIGPGATILAQACVTGPAKIGKGLLMYPNAIVTHDCTIGDFVELSPGATLLGGCSVDAYSHVGANATILPNTKIGKYAVLGAGSVVTKSVEDYQIVKGVPAS
jgi:sugar O-acyltransferase (sialic acid O-acetyltransferase NeuD family)